MEPIIYTFPKQDEIIKLDKKNIIFDQKPSPKLIKYGFNHFNEQLDLHALTVVPYYRVGMKFDFENENGITAKAAAAIPAKHFDQLFAEFWEILNTFSFLNQDQQINTNYPDVVKDLVASYQQLSQQKDGITITNKKATLVMYRFSNIDIDENALIELLIKQLPQLLSVQNTNSSLIIQLFNLQTQTSAEIIYYLTSLYHEAYIMKPMVTSDLSDSKYLILIGLKEPTQISFPKYPNDWYLSSIGIGQISENFINVIQCINAKLIPKKYLRYYQIKAYLDTKVYEGITYQEMLQSQQQNTEQWLESFTNIEQMKLLLNHAINSSTIKCKTKDDLIRLYS